MTIGADGGLLRLIESIAGMVEKAGSQHKADRIRDKNTLSEAASIAGEWFQHAACLFLVDDIWCVNGIAPEAVHELRSLARHTDSRVAFTARDTKVDCGRKIVFRERRQYEEQAHCILLRCADVRLPTSAEAIEAFNGILKLCNGLPIALSVCGRAVKHYATERCASCPEDAWVLYLQRYGDQAVLSTDDGEGVRRMRESVLLSLDLIDEKLDITASRTWFTALCVLQKQQMVRSDVLRRLWSVSNDMSDRFIDYIERFGTAQVHYGGNDKGMLIGLHDVLLDISRELAAEGDELRQWSTRLIASYANSSCCNTSQSDRGTEVLDGFQERWMQVEDDGYIFRNICRLLMVGKCADDLLWMMTSAEWIIKQLLRNGHRQVQEDIQAAMKDLQGTCTRARRMDWEEIRGFLKALHNAVQLSAKRVRESEWNGMAWFEVYGRLVHLQEKNEAVRRFLENVKDKAPRPWLKPSAGCLAPAGESLRHVMESGGKPQCHTEVDLVVLVFYGDAESVYIKRYVTRTGIESSPELVMSGRIVSCAAFSLSGEVLAVGLCDGGTIICKLTVPKEASSHVDSGNSSQDERIETEGEGEMSEESENTRCGVMGWRRVFGCGCFVENSGREGRELDGNGDCEQSISQGRSASRSSREEEICSRHEIEHLRGSNVWVFSVAVSNDGRHVVSGSEDGTVRMWEKDGETWVSAVLHGHDDKVRSASVGGDGKRVVSGSDDHTIRVWEKVGDEWVSARLTGHDGTVLSVSMSGGGTRVVSGSYDKTIRVWENDGDEWIGALLHGHDDIVKSVSMSRDGNRIVSGSRDATVRVWEKDGEKWVSASLAGHKSNVMSVSISSGGNRVVSGSVDHTVRMWEKNGEEWVSAILTVQESYVESASMSASGNRGVSASGYDTICVWERDGEEWVSAALTGHEHQVDSVLMSSNGENIVAKSLYDARTFWWRKENQWKLSDQGTADALLLASDLADASISWKGRVNEVMFNETIRPISKRDLFPTAFGFFIAMDRKPFTAQVDVVL